METEPEQVLRFEPSDFMQHVSVCGCVCVYAAKSKIKRAYEERVGRRHARGIHAATISSYSLTGDLGGGSVTTSPYDAITYTKEYEIISLFYSGDCVITRK